jgi:hypothetical protein
MCLRRDPPDKSKWAYGIAGQMNPVPDLEADPRRLADEVGQRRAGDQEDAAVARDGAIPSSRQTLGEEATSKVAQDGAKSEGQPAV